MKVLKVIVDEMPKSCMVCAYENHSSPFYTNPVCGILFKGIESIKERPSWCPLQTDGWIAVSERLPKPLGWVIGMDNRREVYPCVYEDGQWLNDVQDELPTGCKITHWMPLPKAPEVKHE